mmetsp:Transcript_30790/g.28018  ORF Transcript_30790/g.28018 Transcript_30790/m.28018 type:complete len:147 (-) Transcript_30790:450-890(-)
MVIGSIKQENYSYYQNLKRMDWNMLAKEYQVYMRALSGSGLVIIAKPQPLMKFMLKTQTTLEGAFIQFRVFKEIAEEFLKEFKVLFKRIGDHKDEFKSENYRVFVSVHFGQEKGPNGQPVSMIKSQPPETLSSTTSSSTKTDYSGD